MKLPRNVSGDQLADHICKHWGYTRIAQVGSHIMLRTETPLSVQAGNPCPFPHADWDIQQDPRPGRRTQTSLPRRHPPRPLTPAKLRGIAAQPNPRIFLSAGEASGDHYGAQIISELRSRMPGATFTGLGGTEMAAAGQTRVVRAEDVAHMGITEVIRHMPYIFGQYRKLVGALKRERPAIAILIDFPDVNFRLAKHCKRLAIPVVWFVSPQLWAWKRQRLRWVQKRVSKMLVIFPFEEAFYRNRGVDAEFVGHPLAALPLPAISRKEYAEEAENVDQYQWNVASGVLQSTRLPEWAFYKSVMGIRYALDQNKPWIALLPGSREGEIFANLDEMLEAAIELGNLYEYLIPIAQTVSATTLIDMQIMAGETLGGPNPPRITFVRDARAALHHSRAAIVASGTATVQALTIGNPFVVVYRVSRLTFALAKRLVRYPEEIGDEAALKDADGNLPIAMPNLIAGRRIVPEFLNRRFTAKNLAAALRPLLEDTTERAKMTTDLAETRAKLLPSPTAGTPGTPIERVCDAIESLLDPANERITEDTE